MRDAADTGVDRTTRHDARADAVRVVPYAPAHHAAFRALNLAWITEHFAVEPPDLHALDDPEGHILEPGGAIFVAELGARVVGTVAMLPHADGSFELAKMAVDPDVRGHGVGRLLGEAALAWAAERGAPYVELLSNTKLAPAIRLYRRLGFEEVPLPRTEYARANVKMVRRL